MNKIQECKHENLYDYVRYITCATPYCDCIEFHCKDCRAYIMECGCGYMNEISGWPWSRRKKCKSIIDNMNKNARNFTKEESDKYEKSIEKLSKPTGINFNDLLNKRIIKDSD